MVKDKKIEIVQERRKESWVDIHEDFGKKEYYSGKLNEENLTFQKKKLNSE